MFLRLFAFSLILFFLGRVVFALAFYSGAEAYSLEDILKAFWLGFRFDVRVALMLAMPILLYQFFRNKFSLDKKIWAYFYGFVFFWVYLFYAGDLGYYAYLNSRINFRIFEFFENPLISLQMVVQSYNLFFWLPALAALTYGTYLAIHKYILASTTPNLKKIHYAKKTLFAGLILFGIHGRPDQYPLRWSEAFFTQNVFVSSVAMNPIHYIFDTAKNSKANFNLEATKKYYQIVAKYLGVKDLNVENLNFKRPVAPTPPPLGGWPQDLNVVYIVMESMAAYKTGAFGNHPDSSPAFDSLTQNGWLFRNFYVPTEGTARSMFCTLTGIPDINAKSTSSRNPLIVNQHTLINSLTEHDRYFFIGGSANWGNIRGVYMNNIHRLQMYEDKNLEGPRADVWGLSDLDLFRQSAKVLKNRDSQKPFFALIQAASFHRPYTIPEDHGDFKLKTLTQEELTRMGFESNEEYNSFRFSDYSLGEFFRLIKDSPIYENSVFVVHGDHGLPHYGAHHLTEGYRYHGLNRFHTPLVFYAPKVTKKKEFEQMMIQPDVWPTLLGLMNVSGTNTSLGRNILLKEHQQGYALSYVYYSTPLQVLLYDQTHLAFGTEAEVKSLHLYNSAEPTKDIKNENLEKFNEMQELLHGLFETSKYMLYHNPKL